MRAGKPVRVIVVDDSAIVRRILRETLDADEGIEVVGVAPDPYVARDKILSLKPDVITLDIEMPRMDGLTFLKKLMHYRPMPVIVISSIGNSSCDAAMEAMRLGAVEVLAKPSGPYSVGELRVVLPMKIHAAARARLKRRAAMGSQDSQQPRKVESANDRASRSASKDSIIAIGASTGGTTALETLLRDLPAEVPGIVIVQHIPPGFSRAFANRLHQVCRMEVQEASNGDFVAPSRALIAPGDCHMLVRRVDNTYRVTVKSGPRICYQRPSVDLLFESVAEAAGSGAVGVILTGMGADGAEGMLKMKRAGAYNLAQDEESCVVYGMPREAVKAGGVDKSLPLGMIGAEMLRQAARRPAANALFG